MRTDGTLELRELVQVYRDAGRSAADAEALYRRLHRVPVNGWWIPPRSGPARPAWLDPKTPPPCKQHTEGATR